MKKDKTLFGKILWRVFATSGTVILLAIAICIIIVAWQWGSNAYDDYQYRRQQNDPTYLHKCRNRYVSPNIIYHDGEGGYLYDVTQGRRTMTGITWICRSEDGDSLTFFSNNDKKGYFNRFTGKMVVPPQYEKAWVFSEGVACVMKQGQIQVIDHSGQGLLDKPFAYTPRIDDYCFHHGMCIMMGDNERIGLIDKQGQWVIEPKFKEINYMEKGFWLVYDSVWNKGLLYHDGREFLPCEYEEIKVYQNIFVRNKEHLDQVYDYEGHIINACDFSNVETMEFESDEFIRNNYYEIYERKTEVAHLRKYTSSDYYYGLMDKDGNPITPPYYGDIRAIAADRYLCEGPKGTVILDDNGRECKASKSSPQAILVGR